MKYDILKPQYLKINQLINVKMLSNLIGKIFCTQLLIQIENILIVSRIILLT